MNIKKIKDRVIKRMEEIPLNGFDMYIYSQTDLEEAIDLTIILCRKEFQDEIIKQGGNGKKCSKKI